MQYLYKKQYMDIEVFCDESCLEALINKNAHRYVGIGSVWIPADNRQNLKDGINKIKANYNIKGELKWKKLSPTYLNLYKEIVDFYFCNEFIRFRIILIESEKVNSIVYHGGDNELSFYKFYYQLLNHWILDFNQYDVFLDFKVNRNKGRLKTLREKLQSAHPFALIKQVQGLPSEESVGIQLADLLTGMVTAKFNDNLAQSAKKQLIEYVEKRYRNLAPTHKWEEKLNVFKISLQGGW